MKIFLKDQLSQTCLVYLLVLNYFCFPQTLQKAQTNNRLDSESRENIGGYKDFIRVDDPRESYGGKGMHQSNRKTKSFCSVHEPHQGQSCDRNRDRLMAGVQVHLLTHT